uniref:Helitron helicase n=1 Tax=Syphacia muris TaxID=451379 RepID=A0A0N5AY86_9BILA
MAQINDNRQLMQPEGKLFGEMNTAAAAATAKQSSNGGGDGDIGKAPCKLIYLRESGYPLTAYQTVTAYLQATDREAYFIMPESNGTSNV